MLLVLLVAVGNLALGFFLAAHWGHGPAWAKLPSPEALRSRLQKLLQRAPQTKQVEPPPQG